MKKKIHLICNSHLDPVWLWPWSEGLAEAISTFRIAADFCDKHDDFVFVHNESLLYVWVKKYDPVLFERIEKLVKKGAWHVAGGAYLQPDLNNVSGETHIRNFLYGLHFFLKKLGTRPRTAYNFDSFGQPEGLAQILSGCGMDSYIFCRPDHGAFDLPKGAFIWKDRSGISILARRSDDHYCTNGAIVEKFDKFIEHFENEPETMLLWGLGNHGGAVSRKEYGEILEYASKHSEYEFIHSTPEKFFESIRKKCDNFPVCIGEFQNIFPGCYSSMNRVKRLYRQAENRVLALEKFLTIAFLLEKTDYHQVLLDTIWKDILFASFHDILPGSGTERIQSDSVRLLNRCLEHINRLEVETFISLVGGERKPNDGEVPVFLFNPHCFDLDTVAEIEYHAAPMVAPDSKIYKPLLHENEQGLEIQQLKIEANLNHEVRVRLAVPVSLKPFEIKRLNASYKIIDASENTPIGNLDKVITLNGRNTIIKINTETGFPCSAKRRDSDFEFIKPNAFKPVLFKDIDHSWICGDPEQMETSATFAVAPAWTQQTAEFSLASPDEIYDISPAPEVRWGKENIKNLTPVRIIEQGDILTVIEAVFICGQSTMIRHYTFCPLYDFFKITDRVFYNHRDHIMKLEIPFNFTAESAISETPYSAISRTPTEKHEEKTNQRWVAVTGRNETPCVAVINDGSFAHSFTKNTLCPTYLRSPAYSSFMLNPENKEHVSRFAPRQDQGEHIFNFEIMFMEKYDETLVSQRASLLNAPLLMQVYYPDGSEKDKSILSSVGEIIKAKPSNIQVCAMKKAMGDDNDIIIRVRELDGENTNAELLFMQHLFSFEIHAYEIKTFRIKNPHSAEIECFETNLVEGL